MKVACLFLTWNSERFLADSIGRLCKFTHPEDIIVVDNGSTDNTVEMLTRKYPGVALYRLPGNAGFAGGNNVGIKEAMRKGYDAVFLLNVDTIIDEDLIGPCTDALQKHSCMGIVGPVVVEADAPGVIQCEGGRILASRSSFPYRNRGQRFRRRDELIDVGYVLGAAMMIRRELIETIGYMDEDYYPAYVEEADYCYRAHIAGYRCAVHCGSAIRHIGKQSSGGRQPAFNRISAHRFYFAIKHSGPFSFLVASVSIATRIFYWKCRAAVFSRL